MAIESRFLKGKKVFSDWEIKEYIGSGSGGKTAVFRIVRQHEGWEEAAALKVINVMEEIGSKEELAESYRREYEAECAELSEQAKEELRLMSCLQGNPNIVEYYDFAFVEYQGNNVFGLDLLIRMELLENLREEQKRKDKYTEQEVLRIGKDICKGLKFCHKIGIIHRDIKPANIFVTPWGSYKLGDFGIARMLEAGQRASTKMGTRAYAAPEQFMSNEGNYDEKVDIYSLGLTLYELANGNRLPFATSAYVRESEIQMRLMGKEIPDPCNAGPLLAGVIKKACTKEAGERYASAEEFESALVATEIGMLTQTVEPEETEEEELQEETTDKHTKTVKMLKIVIPVLVALELVVMLVLVIRYLGQSSSPQMPQTNSAPVVSEVTEPSVAEGPTMEEVISTLGKIKYTTASATNGALITENGDLYMWGENGDAQVGCGNQEYQPVPVRVLEDVASVYLSETHTAAIKTNGDLYLWGRDMNLEIGNGNGFHQLYPAKILSDVKEVSLGDTHSGALCNNGDLYGWGNPNGNGIGVDKERPTLIASGVQTFYMNHYEGGAVTEDGKLMMWGENSMGQVGIRGAVPLLTPVKVMEDVQTLRIGNKTAAAIKENGDLYMWGESTEGQTGTGYFNCFLDKPEYVMSNVREVVLADEHSAAITENGDLYMWGDNASGEFGFVGESGYVEPAFVDSDVASVVLGNRTTAVIKENGDLYLCGDNSSGQIVPGGDWKITQLTKVAERITSVGVGWSAAYAVDEDGKFYYWD